MKFKEITPGMVIHCPKEEDARALLEHINNIGLMWPNVDSEMENYKRYGTNTCFSIQKDNVMWQIGYGHVRDYIERKDTITEFSDLIESEPNTSSNALNDKSNAQMSAVEVLEWLIEHCGAYCDNAYEEAFGEYYSFNDLFLGEPHEGPVLSPQEIVEKIEQYEAAKKAPKPMEIEGGYHCVIIKKWVELRNMISWR